MRVIALAALSSGWLLLGAFACGAEEEAAPQADVRPEGVQVGEWRIVPHELSVDSEGPSWTGSAVDANGDGVARLHFLPCGARERWFMLDRALASGPVEIEGVGEIECRLLERVRPMTQGPPDPHSELDVRRIFVLDLGDQRLYLSSSERAGPLPPREELWQVDLDPIRKRLAEEALRTAAEDHALPLLRALVGERVVLDRAWVAVPPGRPVVSASVDGGEMLKLKGAGGRKGPYDASWNVPARPGQEVVLEVKAPYRRYVATTHGVFEVERPQGSPGALTVQDRAASFDSRGVATADLGCIAGPRMISFSYPGFKRSERVFRGGLLPRWGRPGEEWLASCRYPLSPPPKPDDPRGLLDAVLTDVASAYDPDQGGFLRNWDDDRLHSPGWPDAAALRGLDIEKWPMLEGLCGRTAVGNWTKSLRLGGAERSAALDPATADRLLVAARGHRPPLWARFSSYDQHPSGWHHPEAVFLLAALRERFPELAERVQLARVLDFWVEDMRREPDPIHMAGKGSTGRDRRPDRLAFAVAALHAGAKAFGKDAYAKTRDLQLARLGADLEAADPERVAAYGQACAYVGDEEGLEAARAWIRSALLRADESGRAAHEKYRDAPLGVRLGLLAVLRGVPALFTAPQRAE